MILDFTISNFMSIKDSQTISFEATNDTHLDDFYVVKKDKYRILKIATILGANASGKSNVLKAIELFRHILLTPCENKQSVLGYEPFALDDNSKNQSSQMIVNFLCGSQKYRYELHFTNRIICYELLQRHPFGDLRAHKVYERITDDTSLVSKITWGDRYKNNTVLKDLNINLLHNRSVFGAFLNSNIDVPWMKEIIDWADAYLMPMVDNSNQGITNFVCRKLYDNVINKDTFIKQLKKADLGISDFIIEKIDAEPIKYVYTMLSEPDSYEEIRQRLKNRGMHSYKIHLLHNGANGTAVPLDFSQESNGTQRYFELLGILLLLVDSPRFLCVDELECRMHPDLYEHFIISYLTNAKDSQMVFTTHIREFLNDRNKFRDDSVWFTEKSKDGATELYSLADFGTDVLRKNTNRYNVYTSGKIGAIPCLADHYIESSKNKCNE